MEPMQGAFGAVAAGVGYGAPQVTMVSTVTGAVVGAGELGAEYWVRQVREPVRFAAALATARRQGAEVLVEAGPHPVLTGLGQEWLADTTWVPSLRRGRDDWSQMLEGLAALYVRGVPIDWARVHQGHGRRRISLPTYPWQRDEHWLEGAGASRREVDGESRWADVVAAGRMQAEQAPLDLDLGSYAAKWRALDRLSTAYMVRALQRLGAFGVDGETSSVDDLVRAHGIAPGYRHLLARWLRRLVGEGLLREEANGSFIAPVALPPARDAEALAAARVALRDIPPILEYVERCGSRLEEFLTGKASPLETLFPDGTFDTATALYQDWAVSRYVSAIARAVLGATVEAARGRALRVLEVGAGTGGTAAALVPRLAPDRGTYWYTDVSTAFLARAREKLAAYPFVRYAVLDVERDPAEQGFQRGALDVIVATNVVHATRDVEATLRRLRSLLAPGGVLILGEATTHLAWFDVTTGLIEGWQRFEDASRGDSPLLAPVAWDRALRAAGFDAVACLPESGSAATVLGQHVLVGRVPAGAAADDLPAGGPAELEAAEPEPSTPVVPVGDVARRLAEAGPADRHALALEYVTLQVAAVLRMSRAETLDPRQRLMDLGLDSLMALELRGRLAVGLGLAGGLPATLVFEHPTIDAVARYLVREALGVSEPIPAARRHEAATPSTDEAAARIAHLSEEEVAALLLKKLESL